MEFKQESAKLLPVTVKLSLLSFWHYIINILCQTDNTTDSFKFYYKVIKEVAKNE